MVENLAGNDSEIFWNEKKSTFIKLKLWEDTCHVSFSRYRRILESLTNYIFAKCHRGKETSLTIARYLKEHSIADHTYSVQLSNQLMYLPSSTFSTSSASLKSSLTLLSQAQQTLSNQFRDLSQSVQK